VQQKIVEEMEEAARFVSLVLGYSPADVERLNCFTFFRDLLRAENIQAQQRKSLEKWQTKGKQ